MMKKLSLGLLALLVCISAQADLLVYKLRYTITRTGDSATRKMVTTGWMVIDNENDEIALIKTEAKIKRLNTERPTLSFTGVKGFKAKYVSAFRVSPGELSGNMTFRGFDVEKNPDAVPTTMQIGGLDWWQTGSAKFLDEYKGTAVLNQAETRIANGLIPTLENAVSRLEAEFKAKGFFQSDEF